MKFSLNLFIHVSKVSYSVCWSCQVGEEKTLAYNYSGINQKTVLPFAPSRNVYYRVRTYLPSLAKNLAEFALCMLAFLTAFLVLRINSN